MGMYVLIKKRSETEERAVYRFESDGDAGVLEVAKATGEVKVIEAMPTDVRGRCFACAARKVWLAWQRGEYPDVLTWAS